MKSLHPFNKIKCKVMPMDPNSQKENHFSKIIPSDLLQPNYKSDTVHNSNAFDTANSIVSQ